MLTINKMQKGPRKNLLMRTFNDAAKDILKYKVSETVLRDAGFW